MKYFHNMRQKKKHLVGSLNLKYQVNNEINDNFSTVYNIFYTTNHYKEDLRYQVFSPSITVKF